MNAQQAASLAYYVKRARPHQAFEQETPATWADTLIDVRYEDGQQAVRELTGEQEYVLAVHVKQRVKRIRSKRIAEHPALIPPPELADDVAGARAWLREATRRIGDGEQIDSDAAYGVLRKRDMRELSAPKKETP